MRFRTCEVPQREEMCNEATDPFCCSDLRRSHGDGPVRRPRAGSGAGPRDGHRHVHGANLGVRASTYFKIGGFQAMTAHEDIDLIRRLEAADAHIQWCGRAPVVTSTRPDGRATDGFSAYLRRLGADTDLALSGADRASGQDR